MMRLVRPSVCLLFGCLSVQMVNALKMGRMKPTKPETEEEEQEHKYYMLWRDDDEVSTSVCLSVVWLLVCTDGRCPWRWGGWNRPNPKQRRRNKNISTTCYGGMMMRLVRLSVRLCCVAVNLYRWYTLWSWAGWFSCYKHHSTVKSIAVYMYLNVLFLCHDRCNIMFLFWVRNFECSKFSEPKVEILLFYISLHTSSKKALYMVCFKFSVRHHEAVQISHTCPQDGAARPRGVV